MKYLQTKHEQNSAKITTLIVVIVVLLCFVVGQDYQDLPEEYGVAINFGDASVLNDNVQPNALAKIQETESEVEEPEEVLEEETAEEVVEEIVVIKEIKNKTIGKETIKGDPDAVLTVEPVGKGPAAVIEEDNTVYNTAGIEVKPDFPGGMGEFNKFVARNYQAPEEEGLKGKVYVTFVVEKDGSLTDIKVLRDIGYGTGKEAIRVLNKCPRWTPGEQNGKKVRCTFSLPISIQSAY